MKPVDKFGRPIFPRIFDKLKEIGYLLTKEGWMESRNKPNLFYKIFDGVPIFADMRGTMITPIWLYQHPIIFVGSSEDEPWKKARALRYAVYEFDRCLIPYSSFTSPLYPESEDGLEKYSPDVFPDGQCKTCEMEINNDGLFCSEKCEKTYRQLERAREERHRQLEEMEGEEVNQAIKCVLCGKNARRWDGNLVEHHINYEEKKTVFMCRSCHRKIHWQHEKYPELAPRKPKQPEESPELAPRKPKNRKTWRTAEKTEIKEEISGTAQFSFVNIGDGIHAQRKLRLSCRICKSHFANIIELEKHWETHLK